MRFAIIGYGYIGKRHAEEISKNPHCELVAVCDIVPKNTEVPFYYNIDELLTADFDCLVVATPNGLHSTHALKALEARKHVIIEKPMALNKADCEAIVHKSLQVGRHVFCVMQNRYSPPSEWLYSTKVLLGKIFMVQVNCYWNRGRDYYKGWKGTKDLDGGTLFTQFSHFVDILYWLFGDIKNIKARFSDFNHEYTDFEDSGIVSFDFINGGMGCINYSTSVHEKNLESSITIIAENGTVKIGGQYMNEVEYCNIKGYVMPELKPANPANDYGSYKGSAMNHNFIYDNVVSTMKNGDAMTTNALEGMKVVDIIERIYDQKPIVS